MSTGVMSHKLPSQRGTSDIARTCWDQRASVTAGSVHRVWRTVHSQPDVHSVCTQIPRLRLQSAQRTWQEFKSKRYNGCRLVTRPGPEPKTMKDDEERPMWREGHSRPDTGFKTTGSTAIALLATQPCWNSPMIFPSLRSEMLHTPLFSLHEGKYVAPRGNRSALCTRRQP